MTEEERRTMLLTRQLLSYSLTQWSHVNCVCGRGKPRYTTEWRKQAQEIVDNIDAILKPEKEGGL